MEERNKCRNQENDEEYCFERGLCFRNTTVCRFCYNWTCRKFAIGEAQKLCETLKGMKDQDVSGIKDCEKRKKTGHWLDPATGIRKKTRKSRSHRMKNNSSSSSKGKKSKIKATRSLQRKVVSKKTKTSNPSSFDYEHFADPLGEISIPKVFG